MSDYYYRHPENRTVVWSSSGPTDEVNPWKDWERLTKREGSQLYREQCKNRLREFVPTGSVVYSLTDHSQSGLTRYVRLYCVTEDSNILQITKWVAFGFGYRLKEKGGREYIATTSTASDLVNHVEWCMYGSGDTIRHEHL